MTTLARPGPAWHGAAVVLGPAQSQGSKSIGRSFGKDRRPMLYDDNQRLKPWREAMVLAMRSTSPAQPVTSPVAVRVVIYVARSRRHYGTGRNAGLLLKSAPELPACGRDIDKCARAILDAGTYAGWWVDDSRVVDLRVSRLYASSAEPERTEVRARVVQRAGEVLL